MKLYDPDIGLGWSLFNTAMKVGYAVLIVTMFLACGYLVGAGH